MANESLSLILILKKKYSYIIVSSIISLASEIIEIYHGKEAQESAVAKGFSAKATKEWAFSEEKALMNICQKNDVND